MKITHVEHIRLDLKMKSGYTIAYESIDQATNVILKLTTSTGLTGWGCAAPDMEITHETGDDVIANIHSYVDPLLHQQNPFQVERIHHTLKTQNPEMRSTLAMVNMALYDLIARKANLPLYQLMGGYRHRIQTSITIGICALDETMEWAKQFWQQGYRILKVKGGLHLEEDIERVIKLREWFGKELTLRFDANQGYSARQAIEFAQRTQTIGIEILEQPTPHANDDAFKKVVDGVSIPVMADESIRTLRDAYRLSKHEISDMINIKLMKVGGLTEAQHINSVAKSAKMEVMVGCLDECSLGIAAGLHFALSRPNVEYADLDGHLDFVEDPTEGLFSINKGWMYPGEEIGLGKMKL